MNDQRRLPAPALLVGLGVGLVVACVVAAAVGAFSIPAGEVLGAIGRRLEADRGALALDCRRNSVDGRPEVGGRDALKRHLEGERAFHVFRHT